MNPTRQLIAVLTLFAWLFAGAHVALDHGGDGFGGGNAEAAHGDHHHDDAPTPDGDDHHHDLGTTAAFQFSKTDADLLLLPQLIPLYDHLTVALAGLLRTVVSEKHELLFGDSPPDARASGWLLVTQTALPVRGPSLV